MGLLRARGIGKTMNILRICTTFLMAVAAMTGGVRCSHSLKGMVPSGMNPFKTVKTVKTTAYTHTEDDHIIYEKQTAAGTELKATGPVRSAAADWSKFPLGTKFKIVGSDIVYEIDDYGSALVGTETIDLYRPSKKAMNRWGMRHVKIKVLKWGSFEKSLNIMKHRTHRSHVRKMVEQIQSRT